MQYLPSCFAKAVTSLEEANILELKYAEFILRYVNAEMSTVVEIV
jgi:hypothetical protein